MEKKTIIIIVAVVGILLGILWFRKKSSTKSNQEVIQSGVSNSLLKGASESVKAVEMLQEDEEYNLLRMEYSDRYGEAPKSSWSKAMIQQKIDEYDHRSSLLDVYVQEAGNKKLEEVSSMNAEEIQREIELAKQEAAQKLLTAQTTYQESMGKAAPSAIQSPEQLYALIADGLSEAKKEYKDFTGTAAPKECNTPVLVKQALEDAKIKMRNDWNARKNHLLSKAALVADKLKNRGIVAVKRELEAALTEVCQYNERDFYVWYENCYAHVKNENRNFDDELKHLNTSILFWDNLQQLAGTIRLRRSTNYRHLAIDTYGRYSA